MQTTHHIHWVIFCMCMCLAGSMLAQKGGLPLAEEYYKNQEYQKAIGIYQNFTNDFENAKKVYHPLTDCYLKTNNYAQAEKLVRKMMKWDEQNPLYVIDAANLFLKQNKHKEAQKIFDKLVKYVLQHPEQMEPVTKYLNAMAYSDITKTIYLADRKLQGNDFLHALEMAELLKKEGKTEEMVAELIKLLLLNHHDKEYLKARFQEYITTDQEFDAFEKSIIEKMQQYPNQYVYNDLLIWTYVQKKDFKMAFLQAKAFDRLMKTQGNKLMEIAKIAGENKAYDTAIEIYAYVEKEYRNTPNYPLARRYKIESKEAALRNAYPIEPTKIKGLIQDYKNLIAELGKTHQTLDAIRSMASLYGFYLDAKDSALILYKEILGYSWADRYFVNKCKLELGDLYVLKNEPWEATLIYAQVEKDMKDQPIGHEAKLRSAKLSYFMGEFELAKEHLDVLKLATTREIANDAIDLSVFIQDNTGLDDDSTHPALRAYAEAELLLFQHKYEEAMVALDTLLKKYKDNAIEDEVWYLQARILQKTGRYPEAIKKYTKVATDFREGIYADDAAFTTACIYDEIIGDKDKAMALYNKFLIDFPASIYAAEARKRFRILRGDNLN